MKAPLPTKSVTLPAINGGTTAGVLITDSSGSVTVGTSLGYAEITSNFTTTSITAVQVTGLSATATFTAGQRVRVTVCFPRVSNSALRNNFVAIWDGTVGSGTTILSTQATTDPAYSVPITASRVYTPGAGTKTYNVSFHEDGAGTATIAAAATSPAYLLIETL